ncbi:MAG: ferrochelatase [Desulfotalea sp.]|nr:MAG: ferrochelatase [Desulfotalea sp.]
MESNKHGIILFNMGGPEKLDDVRAFLYNLFSDRDIIRLGPPFLQKLIAYSIARKRAPKSRSIYSKIGGRSPLKQITSAQAAALSSVLNKTETDSYVVTIAMRYWPPYADAAITELLAQGVDQITALTLYPHYSRATTGSSVSQLKKAIARLAPSIRTRYIEEWPEQPSFIKALAENITSGLAESNAEPTQVVYSAHSLPSSFIEEGDPYVEHLMRTIQAVEKITQIKGRLCYQSRSGPVEWLSPSTPDTIEILAKEGCKNILMVPISFVSDHVETLYEIDILYRQQAEELGMTLTSSASMNTKPLFIEGLRQLVVQGSSEN